jgi:hypothetical protein
VREYLNTHFPGQQIGRAGPIAWLPRSQDLFLWRFVKDRVLVPPLPASVVELRTQVTAAMPEMIRSVWQKSDYMWDPCSITSESHTEP